MAAEKKVQCAFVRDIFGNPFRPATRETTWVTPSIVALAQRAYEERALPSPMINTIHLAALADAVEKAGISDADILEHLRSFGSHVRGCWVVDLVLGKT